MFKQINEALQSIRPNAGSSLAKVALGLAVGWAVVQPAAQAAQCRVEDARYTLKGDAAYTANFIGIKLDADATNQARIALHIRSTESGAASAKDFWLGIEHGNGYNYGELYAIADPALHDGAAVARDGRPSENQAVHLTPMPLLIASKSLTIGANEPLKLSDPAPELFVVPYLGPNLWYEGHHFSDQFNESNRERMPLGFFELSGCAKPVE